MMQSSSAQDVYRLARALGLRSSRRTPEELAAAVARAIASSAPVPVLPRLEPRVRARVKRARSVTFEPNNTVPEVRRG